MEAILHVDTKAVQSLGSLESSMDSLAHNRSFDTKCTCSPTCGSNIGRPIINDGSSDGRGRWVRSTEHTLIHFNEQPPQTTCHQPQDATKTMQCSRQWIRGSDEQLEFDRTGPQPTTSPFLLQVPPGLLLHYKYGHMLQGEAMQ
jgi:hypothetical protein